MREWTRLLVSPGLTSWFNCFAYGKNCRMPRTGRPKQTLELTGEEREKLVRWERRRKSSQALALRSRIVLRCAEGAGEQGGRGGVWGDGGDGGEVAARFCELRLDGLSDDPRPGRPATITAKQVEEVLVATLESTPENATHWSRSKMAERSGLSESTVGRIWRAFGLQPHRADTFKLSNDPLFVEKVYDIVGLYLNPPEAAVVLCVDEKSQVQALARSQPAFPMMPGMPEKRTHDYLRHGTTSLFAAFNTADGTVISSTSPPSPRDRVQEVPGQDRHQVPEHLDVHLICDNYGTHKSPAISAGSSSIPAFTCTTRRRTPAGSTRSSDGSPTSPTICCAAPTTAESRRWRKTSATGSPLEREPQAVHLDQDRRADPGVALTTSSTN